MGKPVAGDVRMVHEGSADTLVRIVLPHGLHYTPRQDQGSGQECPRSLSFQLFRHCALDLPGPNP